MKNMNKYFTQYEEQLRAKNLHQSTIRKELRCLRYFNEFLNDDLDLFEISEDDCRSYLKSLSYLAPSTIETRIGSVTKFFAWLEEEMIIFFNPAKNIKAPTVPDKVVRVITVEQMKELIEAIKGDSKQDYRNRALLEVMYATGIRSGEVVRMKLEDIIGKQILIHGKGSKERMLPLTQRAEKALGEYLRFGRPRFVRGDKDNQYLWLNHYGTRLFKTAPTKIIVKYAQRIKLPKGISAHTIRRSFATHLLQTGANPYMIAKLLGHADMTTVHRYLSTQVEDLRHAITGQ